MRDVFCVGLNIWDKLEFFFVKKEGFSGFFNPKVGNIDPIRVTSTYTILHVVQKGQKFRLYLLNYNSLILKGYD